MDLYVYRECHALTCVKGTFYIFFLNAPKGYLKNLRPPSHVGVVVNKIVKLSTLQNSRVFHKLSLIILPF